jgi:hypothetical protein
MMVIQQGAMGVGTAAGLGSQLKWEHKTLVGI